MRARRGRVREALPFGAAPSRSTGARAPGLYDPSVGTPAAAAFNAAHVSTSSDRGTLYWAVVTNGGACTDAQLIAGSGGNIVAGKAGNQAITASGVQTLANITSLSAATTYQIKFLVVTNTGLSSGQASASGTTL